MSECEGCLEAERLRAVLHEHEAEIQRLKTAMMAAGAALMSIVAPLATREASPETPEMVPAAVLHLLN